MVLVGKLYAESPIYRGNARKTLFTRDGDGSQKLVSLAGEISGTAKALMDAFIGQADKGGNIGLLNRLWLRLYGEGMPIFLITKVICELAKECYPRDHFFDLRMGMRLDEDRWASEANANYKMETLYRNSVFNFEMHVNEKELERGENRARLFYMIQELKDGRFWFGAGKSKGLGRCRLELKSEFAGPTQAPKTASANFLSLDLSFNAQNPLLVGWNWGKVDPEQPAFAAIHGRLLLDAMRDIPAGIRQRLEIAAGGPIVSPESWKKKFSELLPRVFAIFLQEHSSKEGMVWLLPAKAADSLTKGKYPVPEKVMERVADLLDQTFSSEDALKTAFDERLGDSAKKYKRILDIMTKEKRKGKTFDPGAWRMAAGSLGLDVAIGERLAPEIHSEEKLTAILSEACKDIFGRLFQQVDQQINLLQSDVWIDGEIAGREAHLKIKTMLLKGEITERQWEDTNNAPSGVKASEWREFLETHRRVRFLHIMHAQNLKKSIMNDRNHIDFLKTYRDRARQELSQPLNTDFRAGGPMNRIIDKKYGKPYDTVFMRMLTWAPSASAQGKWEMYVPGSTIKGAFRKRASQILKTLWGENPDTQKVLDRLFGVQGQRGLLFFSDAHLVDPGNHDKNWCSMDGVRMNPSNGKPIETAKADYLYAYGDDLIFRCKIEAHDMTSSDITALSLFSHLLEDFQCGDIVLGGEKTSGFGWIEANIDTLTWLTLDPNDVSKKLFEQPAYVKKGIWNALTLKGEEAAEALMTLNSPFAGKAKKPAQPPRASQGFISHRSFGGNCGMLYFEGEILTPTSIKESGEPSCQKLVAGQPVYGWDFFSIAPPTNELRSDNRLYAMPSKSLRGMIRHIYAIASNSKDSSENIKQLNPCDSLFGWVGRGQNQAIMSRAVFMMGKFESAQLAWYKAPYPYGNWRFKDGQWKESPQQKARMLQINDTWRIFPHSPLAPIVQKMENFDPDTPQAAYFRAMLPGSKFRFAIRFWNLENEELQRLIWCVQLENGLAHKIGKDRYLGLGSMRLRLLPDSYLIDWTKRYTESEDAWQLPIQAKQWENPKAIRNYESLKEALNAKSV